MTKYLFLALGLLFVGACNGKKKPHEVPKTGEDSKNNCLNILNPNVKQINRDWSWLDLSNQFVKEMISADLNDPDLDMIQERYVRELKKTFGKKVRLIIGRGNGGTEPPHKPMHGEEDNNVIWVYNNTDKSTIKIDLNKPALISNFDGMIGGGVQPILKNLFEEIWFDGSVIKFFKFPDNTIKNFYAILEPNGKLIIPFELSNISPTQNKVEINEFIKELKSRPASFYNYMEVPLGQNLTEEIKKQLEAIFIEKSLEYLKSIFGENNVSFCPGLIDANYPPAGQIGKNRYFIATK